MSSYGLPSDAPPGAATPHCAWSRRLEYDASWPLGPVPPTTTMCNVPKDGVCAEFPAATTATAPCDHAYSTPEEKPGPKVTRVLSAPRLRLTTAAPRSTTHLMPAPTSASVPDPSEPMARA